MKEYTYIQEGLRSNKTIRWMDTLMPLKFYIAPFRWYKEQANAHKYNGMVLKALKEWEQISQNKIRFQVVQSLHESQINLDWKRIDRKALGHCYFHFDNIGRLYSAEIQIGLSDGVIHVKYMDEKEVYHTILHEIGHALGLGHSPYKTDIMYTPHQYGVVSLSKNDAKTINWLYKIPFGTEPKEFAQKHKVSSNNIDDIIYIITKGAEPSAASRQSNLTEQKDLLEEQTRIAELKKYNLSLQNIQISTDYQDFMKRQR